jgi:hypothetical protein
LVTQKLNLVRLEGLSAGFSSEIFFRVGDSAKKLRVFAEIIAIFTIAGYCVFVSVGTHCGIVQHQRLLNTNQNVKYLHYVSPNYLGFLNRTGSIGNCAI